jgi:hypothetical protein
LRIGRIACMANVRLLPYRCSLPRDFPVSLSVGLERDPVGLE